jgi:hypothetical protein
VRRVRTETAEVPLARVLGDDELPIVDRLVAASPLTDLLGLGSPARERLTFRWHPGVVAVLRDAELARAVAYRWLGGVGADGHELRAVAAASDAWEDALTPPAAVLPKSGARPALAPARLVAADDLRAVTAFLVHLAALVAVAETNGVAPDAPSPLVAASLAARRSDKGRDAAAGLRLLFAVPAIAARVDPALGEPPGVGADSRLARRWSVHRAQVRAALGDERLDQLGRRLAVALAP